MRSPTRRWTPRAGSRARCRERSARREAPGVIRRRSGGPHASLPVSDQAVERWVAGACQAYLDRCVLLRRARDGADLDLQQRRTLPRGTLHGRPASVLVSASATEVRPGSFTIAVRLRPVGGDREVAVDATRVVRLQNRATGAVVPVGEELRTS